MSGNGVDLAAIYQLLGTVAGDVREMRRDLARKADKDDLARLREALVDYHSAVIGHGVLISELDDRLRRVEQHLGLSPSA